MKSQLEPILLTFCVDTAHQEIKDDVAGSRLPGTYSYFCKLWAKECFIISQDSLKQALTALFDPLIALRLFLTNPCVSILDIPYAGDQMVQHLYALALHYHQIDVQDIASLPSKLIDS